jgi:hypothetical protein
MEYLGVASVVQLHRGQAEELERHEGGLCVVHSGYGWRNSVPMSVVVSDSLASECLHDRLCGPYPFRHPHQS